jgi:hypothetical protein
MKCFVPGINVITGGAINVGALSIKTEQAENPERVGII